MLRLLTLGGLALVPASGACPPAAPVSRPYRLAVLSVLAAAGDRGVSRDLIESLLWPERTTAQAGGSLSQVLYGLKTDLPGEEIVQGLGASVLRLNPETVVADVALFEEAVRGEMYDEAVRLYGGAFLDGFHLKAAPEFHHWVDEQRDRLSSAFHEALESVADAALANGNTAKGLSLWRRRAGCDRLDARVARRVVEAFLKAGDRSGALRHAMSHQALVERELGMAADESLSDLARAGATGGSPDLRPAYLSPARVLEGRI